jgi:hypothetical protein
LGYNSDDAASLHDRRNVAACREPRSAASGANSPVDLRSNWAQVWEHSSVDLNDPEQHIRDLERQLADPQRAAQDVAQQGARENVMGSFGSMPPSPPYPGSAPPTYTAPPLPTKVSRFTSESFSYPTYTPDTYRVGGRAVRRALWLVLIFAGPVIAIVVSCAHVPGFGGYNGLRACDALTTDVVKPVLGDGASITVNEKVPRESRCMYQGSNGMVEAEVGTWYNVRPLGFDRQPVPGLGDEAWYSGKSLYVRKGSTGLKVVVAGWISQSGLGDNQAAADEAEKTIAKQLLPKL